MRKRKKKKQNKAKQSMGHPPGLESQIFMYCGSKLHLLINLNFFITGSEATVDNALKINSIKPIIIIISGYVFPF